MAEQTEWVERIDQFVSGTVHEQVRGFVQQMHEGFAQLSEALAEQATALSAVRREIDSIGAQAPRETGDAAGESGEALQALRETIGTEMRELVATLNGEVLDEVRSSLVELAGVREEIAALAAAQGEVAEQVRRAVQDSAEQVAAALRTEVRASVDRFSSGREEALNEMHASEQRTTETVRKQIESVGEDVAAQARAHAEELAKRVDGFATGLSRLTEGREDLERAVASVREEFSKQLARTLKESSGTTALAIGDVRAALVRQAETLHAELLKDLRESLANGQQETLKGLKESSGTLALAIGDVRASLMRQAETFHEQTLTEIQTRFTGLIEEVRDEVTSESKRVQRHLAELVSAMKKEIRRPADGKAEGEEPLAGAFEFASKRTAGREAKPSSRSSKPTNGAKEKGKPGE
jgi:gas vesicle protein